jgi:DNA-binding MarR family transcriptional regulator
MDIVDTTRRRAASVKARANSPADDAALAGYAGRGPECAYGNLRMVARAVGAIYEDALKPVDLRAGQLSLMWAILATEPVEMSRLGRVTLTDPTTLSRTVAKLRKAGWVSVRADRDGRKKVLTLSAAGRARFAAAMPRWEEAQRSVARLVSVTGMRALARRVHKAVSNGEANPI